MKRDMDLARKILFEVEKSSYKPGWIDLKIEGYSREEISYHVMLLEQAGLIIAKNVDLIFTGCPLVLHGKDTNFLMPLEMITDGKKPEVLCLRLVDLYLRLPNHY